MSNEVGIRVAKRPMKVEVVFAHADGTTGRHRYESPSVWIQVWCGGRAQVTLLDGDGHEAGMAQYSTAVFVRRGTAVGDG